MDGLSRKLSVWTERIQTARVLHEIARSQRMRGVDKLDAAAVAMEKLEDGLSFHGDGLASRIVNASERLAEVAVRGHRVMDAREAVIDRVEATIDRVDRAIGGNAPPTTRSSTASSTASADSSALLNGSAPKPPADEGGNPHSKSGSM